MSATPASRRQGRLLTLWAPEDKSFWEREGEAIAKLNLWISVPALFLAFAIWQVWSVVAVSLPGLGFKYSTNQLFWLAAAPALSGATLRIFYSFMVPLVGGRRWTAISTASLLIPAIGIGFAVQDNTTTYPTMLILALLCGLGGGNFSSSMANISFFFPKERKGSALGVNAGLGNLGVSVVQFLSPLVVTAGIFGIFGGEGQTIVKNGQTVQVWTQNAAFIWVPWIALTALAAWFGMNDIADAKASFAAQAAIFKRKHNWLMCVLYLGTFGSFIGYAAGFPLLIKSQFPGINPLAYAWLGPLVGAVIRPFGGWLADKLSQRDRRWFAWLPAIAFAITIPFWFGIVYAPTWQIALACIAVPALLNTCYLAPALAVVQNAVAPNRRTISGAVLLFVLNLIGLGIGPVYIGRISDAAKAEYGDQSLSIGFLWLIPIVVVTVVAHLFSAWSIGRDKRLAEVIS